MTDIIQILTNLEVNIDKYEFEAFNISAEGNIED